MALKPNLYGSKSCGQIMVQTTLNWFTPLSSQYDEPCMIDLCDQLSTFRKHMYNDTISGCVYLRKPADFPWSQVTVLYSWSENL